MWFENNGIQRKQEDPLAQYRCHLYVDYHPLKPHLQIEQISLKRRMDVSLLYRVSLLYNLHK